MSLPRPASLLRFGEFTLDRETGELSGPAGTTVLQDKPFQVLLALLQVPGQLVSRDELKQRLWDAQTFVDFDLSLNKAVNRLREALNDSAGQPRFIQTLPRKGYRFIGTVDGAANEVEKALTGPALEAVETRSGWNRRPAIYVLVGLIVFGGAIAWWSLRYKRSAPSVLTSRPIRSIAVLPLENLSGDSTQDYLVDGLTDELITNLAKQSSALRVISRTSVMRFKGTKTAVSQIAGELQVDALVEGSVIRSADRVRVRIQLIDAASDRHLWAETYERNISDMLQVESEAAHDIAGEINLELAHNAPSASSRRHTPSPEVHELYLKGRYFWNKRDRAGYKKAIECFQDAIQKDPDYAEAYAGLADAYLFSPGAGNYSPQATAKARHAAETALRLDDSLAEAHATMGLIAANADWDWETSKRHYLRALELDPNYPTAHHWYADTFLVPTGHLDEALLEMRSAQKLDPLSLIINTDIGKHLAYARRYPEAIAQLQKTIDLDRQFALSHYWLWYAYTEAGNCMDASAELQLMPGGEPVDHQWLRTYLEAKCGDKQKAYRLLQEQLRSSGGSDNPTWPAWIYSGLGDKDQSFAWLDRGISVRVLELNGIKTAPLWDPLRSDPRFPDVLRRLGLPQ
ncbi:MAG TPA: tetratricopeptide repeat protein [Dongiaceae bacterium]|nr:tetratricopeptide repeat protein [Dongiaceae bacterium]